MAAVDALKLGFLTTVLRENYTVDLHIRKLGTKSGQQCSLGKGTHRR